MSNFDQSYCRTNLQAKANYRPANERTDSQSGKNRPLPCYEERIVFVLGEGEDEDAPVDNAEDAAMMDEVNVKGE